MSRYVCLLLILVCSAAGSASAQEEPPADATPVEEEQTARQAEDAAENEIADAIAVEPTAADDQIKERITDLLGVLAARRGFREIVVEVEEGVVFLDGEAPNDRQRNFAGEIARNVDGVVHVDNELKVAAVSPWTLQPAWAELSHLGADGIRFLPFLVAGVVILLVGGAVSFGVRQVARTVLDRDGMPAILRHVLANLIALPVLLIAVFLALRVSGLTRLALSVLGGTGLFGLVIGIAFRDIFENFLASLLISTNRPFTIGDLITVDGHKGFVQAVTTRGTLLMTLEGNHVHIPNSVIYKATVINLTSNPNMRLQFIIGIDYEDEPAAVQAAVLATLKENSHVLDTPEPIVVVDELGASTVNLRCLFWTNIRENSDIKVKSQVIRATKRRLEADGFTMPDEQREIIFPKGVPVDMVAERTAAKSETVPEPSEPPCVDAVCVENAEGDMQSEEATIRDQASRVAAPISGERLVDEGSVAMQSDTTPSDRD